MNHERSIRCYFFNTHSYHDSVRNNNYNNCLYFVSFIKLCLDVFWTLFLMNMIKWMFLRFLQLQSACNKRLILGCSPPLWDNRPDSQIIYYYLLLIHFWIGRPMDSSISVNFIQLDSRDLFAAVSRLSQAPCCYHICQTLHSSWRAQV